MLGDCTQLPFLGNFLVSGAEMLCSSRVVSKMAGSSRADCSRVFSKAVFMFVHLFHTAIT